MKLTYSLSNIIRGAIIYTAGDSIASLISDEFTWIRLVGILIMGATFYAFEIPNYFKWIDSFVKDPRWLQASLKRTLLAILYFNPLWIARHILLIKFLNGEMDQLNWNILEMGAISFAVNVPVSLVANYFIQNKISGKWRFVASAIFSGLMAIYYSFSAVWFG